MQKSTTLQLGVRIFKFSNFQHLNSTSARLVNLSSGSFGHLLSHDARPTEVRRRSGVPLLQVVVRAHVLHGKRSGGPRVAAVSMSKFGVVAVVVLGLLVVSQLQFVQVGHVSGVRVHAFGRRTNVKSECEIVKLMKWCLIA